MRQAIEDFLQSIVDAFVTGDVDFLAQCYAPPMVVYRPGAIALKANKNDVLYALKASQVELAKVDVTSARVRIHRISHEEKSVSISCYFDFEYLNDGGEMVRRSRLCYILEPHEDTFRVVMVDYEEAAFEAIFAKMQEKH